MKYLVFVITLLLLCVSLPVMSDDFAMGSWSSGDALLGVYAPQSHGNQDWVREYDGRSFDVFGLEQLNLSSYDGENQYWLDATDLILGNPHVTYDMLVGDRLRLSASTNYMTHRLAAFPGLNPYLSKVFYTPSTAPAAGIPNPTPLSGFNTNTGIPFGFASLDLTPKGTKYQLDRNVETFDLAASLGRYSKGAVRFGYWTEKESGLTQLLFRENTGSIKEINGMNVDRDTQKMDIGTDVSLGKENAVSYTIDTMRFYSSNSTLSSTLTGIPSTSDLVKFPNIASNAGIIKARAQLGNGLYFTGVHTDRGRKNSSAIVPNEAGYTNPGSALDVRVESKSDNYALTDLVGDNLTLTLRWRQYDMNNMSPPVISSGSVVNQIEDLSHHTSSTTMDASFTGIRKAYLSFGLEHKTDDRSVGDLMPNSADSAAFLLDGTPIGNIQSDTTSNIWRTGLRWYPGYRISFQGNYEQTNTKNPAYLGLPTDASRLSLSSTYMATDTMALYADYNRWQSKNNNAVRANNLEGTALTGAEARDAEAGHNYRSDFKTSEVGAWYALNEKLTLDTNFSWINIDSSELWVIGSDPTAPPLLNPFFAPFLSDTKQISVGLVYALSKKTRLSGHHVSGDSKGHSVFVGIPGNVTLPLGWNPTSITQKQWTLGIEHDLAKGSLILDYTFMNWKDKIDPSQSGNFGFGRIAFSFPF